MTQGPKAPRARHPEGTCVPPKLPYVAQAGQSATKTPVRESAGVRLREPQRGAAAEPGDRKQEARQERGKEAQQPGTLAGRLDQVAAVTVSSDCGRETGSERGFWTGVGRSVAQRACSLCVHPFVPPTLHTDVTWGFSTSHFPPIPSDHTAATSTPIFHSLVPVPA
jgi:hypothetical protein